MRVDCLNLVGGFDILSISRVALVRLLSQRLILL